MQYRLYTNSTNDIYGNILHDVLHNRDIDNVDEYMNLDDSVVIDYKCLDNIDAAIDLFMYHFNKKTKISILVDEDVDGMTSASVMYNYIKDLDSDYDVNYIMHNKAKAHGLGDVMDNVLSMSPHLLIIPDAGTNDVKECKLLREQGWDIIILDHHEQEIDEDNNDSITDYAIVVNNQMSDNYSNKQFCGVGIVYKFVKAIDEYTWSEYADNYLDLVALGNISDVMDMRSPETKYLVDLGLNNINNPMFKAMINAQEYSMNGIINIHNIQWYITPQLNGCIRFGSKEEKELLFRGFICDYEEFEYHKRATKNKPAETILEDIYDRAARLSKNAKSRQDKARDKSLKELIEIADKLPEDNKVLIIDSTEILDNALSGVVAIKMSEKYNKPCLILQRYVTKNGVVKYGGSARNVDYSPIDSFKNVINSTGLCSGKGHANACGLLNLYDIDKVNNKFNEILSDVEYDSTYRCDYIVDCEEIDVGFVSSFTILNDYLGQGIDEPLIAVENIVLNKDDFEIVGKLSDTVIFNINGVKFVQFRCNEENNKVYEFLQNSWDEEDTIEFNIVGVPEINEYNGVKTPQIAIKDNVVIKTTLNDCDEDDEW